MAQNLLTACMDPRKSATNRVVRMMVSICGVHDDASLVVRAASLATLERGSIVASTNTTPAVITMMDVDCIWGSLYNASVASEAGSICCIIMPSGLGFSV